MRKALHGTRSKYTSGCRCRTCSAANTAYHRLRYAVQKNKQPESREEYFARIAAKCGSYESYKHGCRCRECRNANAVRHAAWYARNRRQSSSVVACGGCGRTFSPHGLKCHLNSQVCA